MPARAQGAELPPAFRSHTGSAKLTADIFPFKKREPQRPLFSPARFSVLLLAALALPEPLGGQLLFDWPIRAVPQPEAVIIGAGALFWNPGSLSEGMGTREEVWIAHVDGPDATGVRGMAVSTALDLPLRLRLGMGYWHLGIPDIPRTTDSPLPKPGSVEVAEDVLLLALARDLEAPASLGGGVRIHRASVAGEVEARVKGDVGLHLRPRVAFSPRIGLVVRNLGYDTRLLAGLEVALPPLAQSRIPLHLGYGVEKRPGPAGLEQRFSLRGSWMERFHVGVGLNGWEGGDGWTALWMLGFDFDRYSFSVLREELANGFGPAHFFRGSIRFSRSPEAGG